MRTECISQTVDSWIVEEDFPTRAGLRVIRTTDPDFGMSEEEIEDRNEFIRCYLLSTLGPILMVPKPEPEDDFFIPDCQVTDPEYSAFNTHDFERLHRRFDKYAYAMKMIVERVKDLAILHSSLSAPEARLRVYSRYESILHFEFRERILELAERYPRCRTDSGRFWVKQQIAELNSRILDCQRVWEQNAPPEVWDA